MGMKTMNKQYLMMIEESNMALIKQVTMGLGIQFLEVQGMGMAGGSNNVLVTPIHPPVPPAEMPESAPESTPAVE